MITVIIPTYNRSKLLNQTIQNVLQQSYQPSSIIIIDDCSTDNTESVVKSYQNNSLCYIKNQKRLGTTQSRIKGLKLTKTKWIAFLDDDDKWHINKLKLQYEKIKLNKADFVISDYYINHFNKSKSRYVSMEKFALNYNKNIISSPGPFFQCCLFSRHFLIKNIDLFDERSEPSEDWDFFISIAHNKLKIEYINQALFYWVYSKKSQSFNKKREFRALEYIAKKHKNKISSIGGKSALSLHYRRLGFLIKQKNIRLYKKYYKQAFIYNPLNIKNIYFYLKSRKI